MEAVSNAARFVIEDEIHAEIDSTEYKSFDDALKELKTRSEIPWDQLPNVAPCTNWKECGRHYEIVEYIVAETPWKEVRRQSVLSVSAAEIKWHLDAT